MKTTPKIISFEELTGESQDKILRQDPDEKFIWYAKKHGIGYSVQRIDPSLEDLLAAQGGMGAGWMLVTPNREELSSSEEDRVAFLEEVVDNAEYGSYLEQRDTPSAENY